MARSKPQLLQKVVSLCRRRGFFFRALPSKDGKEEERYVLGLLGAELKRNLINEWLVESCGRSILRLGTVLHGLKVCMMDFFFFFFTTGGILSSHLMSWYMR